MDRRMAVLYCYSIIYVAGAVIREKTANVYEQDLTILPGDELVMPNKRSYKTLNSDVELEFNLEGDPNKAKSSLDDSSVKIKETDLYENGQDAKENNERSFIILNQKFKSQRFDPRPLPQKSLFDEIPHHFDAFSIKGNVKNSEERVTPTQHHEDIQKVPNSYAYQFSASYFNPVPVAVPVHAKGEYVELLKRPLVRPVATSNERTKMSRPIKDFFMPNDEGQPKSHLFNDDEDSDLLPNENHQQYFGNSEFSGQKFQRKTTENLVRKKLPAVGDINPVTNQNLENTVKLYPHVRNTLSDVLEDEHASQYNCYNENCQAVLNKHNKILNNGIKLGLRCLCEESFLRDKTGCKGTESLKDKSAVYGYSTELTDSEEAIVRETAKLISIDDDFGVAIAK